MTAWKALGLAGTISGAAAVLLPAAAVSAQVVIVGNDSKARLVDGKLQIDPNGEQTVSIVGIGGYGPSVRATIPVPNSIFGPPTNLQVTPDEKLALVAEAVMLNEDQSKFVPSDKVHVIDLEANPPRVIDSVTVGKQPSGLAIRPDGKLALVANRGETSVSVLGISGKTVKFEGKVEVKDQPAHVVFTPDGKRALVNKASTNQVALLAIDGMSVTYSEQNIPTGIYPYNSDITPDGRLALVANTGGNGRSDGNEDTISVIDLEAKVPHVIDTLPAGDAPEGIAISPTGKVAVTGNLCGSDAPPDAWFYRQRGCIHVFAINEKRVRYVGEIEAGGVPEALAFSPDGGYLLVANLLDKDVSVFRVDGSKVTDTKQKLTLPGHPGSMRGRAR
jgi:DNA-binding beta-propeller fold protein YncE